MATLPYNPTKMLSSTSSDDIIYVLQPGSLDLVPSRLLALNTTGSLGSTNLPYSIISHELPFLDESESNSYTTTIDNAGNILVYTGNCEDAAQGSKFWRFSPANDGTLANGTWSEGNLDTTAVNSNHGMDGANYLAAAFTFPGTSNLTSDMYVFGGMCPNSTSSLTDWTQAANYSNSMLIVQPSQPSQDLEQDLRLSVSSSRGAPVAEAGFSITPLQPTFFESENGTQSLSQNQNFVLVGGHTQQAFINMSQVALFSLPEQSWSFLPVESPSPEPNTDLSRRDQSTVDSRSGHTALLTGDGKKVIVFGGWVGDVSNPADPQLAVLELGEGYGGSNAWQWSIPSQTGPALAQGSGLYGHGAAILPGEVMVIVGGYQILASSNSKRKRTSSPVNTNNYYFNITSNSWSTSYTHPIISKTHDSPNDQQARENAEDKKVGLGVGLALGLLAVIVIFLFYYWYSRRLKRRRDAREEELRRLGGGVHPLTFSQIRDGSSGRPNEMTTVDWNGGNRMSMRESDINLAGRAEPEAERTGLLFEIPSPTRGLRRSLYTRGTYQPTSRYEDSRYGPGFSTIHPIDERDEYDEEPFDASSSRQQQNAQQEGFNILENAPILDPFHDPMGGSRTPSPQSPQDRELEIRRWVDDWTAADALLRSQGGRYSPEKTDRTSSTLSDQSARSGMSSHSIQRSVGSLSRSLSQRSAALFNSTPFRPNNDTTLVEFQRKASQRHNPEHRRAQSLTLHPSEQRTGTAESYATAATSFPLLQSEGEALLGGHSGAGDPSRSMSQSRPKGWMGSIRRALAGMERSGSASPEHNDSSSSSPTKRSHNETGLPRRAASTGTMLWQRRQGARDWNVAREKEGPNHTNTHEGYDEEWDVESAVERRVVQVMFTVPKEKLRVVNRAPDGDGESLLSAEVKEVGDGEEHVKGKGKERE